MKSKKNPFKDLVILAIDPASHKAGVALFLDDKVYTTQLIGFQGSMWSERIFQQREQLDKFLTLHLKSGIVNTLVVENLTGFGHAKLSYSVGSLCSLPAIKSELNLVATSTWKAMARRCGCPDKDPKGIKALTFVRPDLAQNCKSDDEADSVLIGLAYLEKGI